MPVVYVVVQDLSFVVRASNECHGQFLRGDIESLVINSFEGTLYVFIPLHLGILSTLVHLVFLHAHSLTIDYHVARYSTCCIVYYMFLIDQTIYLRFQTHELGDTIYVVLILQKCPGRFLLKLRNDESE